MGEIGVYKLSLKVCKLFGILIDSVVSKIFHGTLFLIHTFIVKESTIINLLRLAGCGLAVATSQCYVIKPIKRNIFKLLNKPLQKQSVVKKFGFSGVWSDICKLM